MLDEICSDLGWEKLSPTQKGLKLAKLLIGSSDRKIYPIIRAAQKFHRQGKWRWRMWATNRIRRNFSCAISPKATIGAGLQIPHPIGIVIGEGVMMGKNCVIYQNVTIGGARRGDWKSGFYPVVGDDVMMFAGCTLIGQITVGDGAIIGANAVVNKDVPPRHIAVGIPARVQPLNSFEAIAVS